MVGASTSQSANLELDAQVQSYQKTLIGCVHSSSAWRQAQRNNVVYDQASLLVSLGEAIKEMSQSLCGRQVVPRTRSSSIVVGKLVKIDPNCASVPKI